MAARGGILRATFLSCTILLPLLASAFFPDFTGPHDIINSQTHHQQVDGDIYKVPKKRDEDDHKGDNAHPHYLVPVAPEEGEEGSYQESPPVEEDPVIEPEPVEGSGDGPHDPEPEPAREPLREGFYDKSCPQAEKIVNETINKHFCRDPTLAPAFVRLFLHDCLVNGCDASILLDETPTGEDVEKKAPHNGPFVRGYDVIDDIKAQLEAKCPGVVSCADILAFTNRDSLVFTGVPRYNVAAGRRDGIVSLARNVEHNIPIPRTPAKEMIQMFQRKGMSLEDLVVLTGAHSIGTAHCSVVSGRFHDPQRSKEIDRGYLIKMQSLTICQDNNQDLPFDPYSQQKMDSRFYNELLNKKALLESDHNLAKEPNANHIMKKYVDDQKGWLAKFTSSVKKLGEMEVLTGNHGEIRKQCRAVN